MNLTVTGRSAEVQVETRRGYEVTLRRVKNLTAWRDELLRHAETCNQPDCVESFRRLAAALECRAMAVLGQIWLS